MKAFGSPNPSIGAALYEVSQRDFLRSSRGAMVWLARVVGVAGPVALALGNILVAGLSFPLQFYLLILLFGAVALGIYLIALSFNRFGIYEGGIAPSKRAIADGWRLRRRQWIIPYGFVARLGQYGSWAERVDASGQSWYFVLELRDGKQVILPGPGIWEAVRSTVRSPTVDDVRELRTAYAALVWVSQTLSKSGQEAGFPSEDAPRLDAAAFKEHLIASASSSRRSA